MIYNGKRIKPIKPGSIVTRRRMNEVIAVFNSLLQMRMTKGGHCKLFVSDNNAILNLPDA